ncbi:BCL-2 homologous antagonist/killer-like [Elysia marginata]|uniref:BCL-2 homologous antagonist/killer-like n=1 Tax=Elysia marginata TaxID=1093978 RepID=A0AAV4ISX1_9GAST|nr:BCL-2 homologous antagonist/killer-like [Elysia marginata]
MSDPSEVRYRPGRGSGTSSTTNRGSQLGLLRPRSLPNIQPDTEENVEAQTETVFRNYVYQSYRHDSMREEVDLTPVVPELVNFPTNPVSPAAQIGRELARFGDDINEKYADVFDGLISSLRISETDGGEETYDAFANIARRVLSGSVSWGRIMILLSFGYRMAIQALRSQAGNFSWLLSKIVSFVTRFVISERISKWIADHGGWKILDAHTGGGGVDQRRSQRLVVVIWPVTY